MMTIVAIGLLILAGIAIICFAAYKIKAESFELSTSFLKLISLSIKIRSPARKLPEDERPGDLESDQAQRHR